MEIAVASVVEPKPEVELKPGSDLKVMPGLELEPELELEWAPNPEEVAVTVPPPEVPRIAGKRL
jgi:hypothetical protein